MPGILKVYNSATSTWEAAANISNAQFTLAENQTPTGSINGSNTAFTLPTGFIAATLKVYKNGVRLKPAGEDYTTTSTGFTMTTAPATGTVLLCDYAFGDGTNIVGGNSLVSDEVPTGSVNGTNKVFTTAQAYVGATLQVFINGVKQRRGADFTETTPSSGTFTMDEAPLTGDVIFVNYSYNLNPSSNADTVDGIHASATPTANMLLPLNSSAKIDATNVSSQYFVSEVGTETALGLRSFPNSSMNGFSLTNSNTRIVFNVAGVYSIFYRQLMSTNANQIYTYIRKNGAEFAYAYPKPNVGTQDVITFGAGSFAVNDYIDLYFSNSVTTTWTGGHSSFIITRIN